MGSPFTQTALCQTSPGSRRVDASGGRGRGIAVAVAGDSGAARSRRGVSGPPVRGYEFVRYTCEESHDHAEGYTACETDKGVVGWGWVNFECRS